MIADKPGYPKDVMELDLDMEGDLGIDTVKQAELFAGRREHYSTAGKENLSLKDDPTVRHCIRFVLGETGHRTQVTSHKPETAHQSFVVAPVVANPPTGTVAATLQPSNPHFSEDEVRVEILDMIAGKTGYPKDMLELDLDMEADLGIDTVKQAELFAALREHYSIARKENLSLKDYPTIRHCVSFPS